MSLWVVGTDTGVGKSLVSALTLLRYRGVGRLAYWKPISTGGHRDRDRDRLAAWVGASGIDVLPETYHFEEPVSPHLAARLAGASIDPLRVLEDLVNHGLAEPDRNLLIEGAGGLFVPINDDGAMLFDLVAETALPVVLVARSTLGTINHTLLSLAALRSRNIEIAGVVLNGPKNKENRKAIEGWGHVKIVDEVEPLAKDWEGFQLAESELSEETIAEAAEGFDAGGVLGGYL